MNYKEYKARALSTDNELAEEYHKLEPEYELIRKFIETRIEKGLTQKELAELCGIKQSNISRLESGNYNPTLSFIKRIAAALGAEVHLDLCEKKR